MSETERITVGETTDGEDVELPVVDVLTGRGFVTGKSGSGKSNTASVVLEELLDAGLPAMVIDTDGEYYGLKEEYELLHAGADEECDIEIGPEHAERMATLALEENVPIILDVSGYLDEDEAGQLIRETARHLFAKEKKLKKPFLMVVEECHEFIPEGGGMDETGKMLVKIGKRGRKHGLGILGISQRPADVKKDFITQANWLTWHRLTWDNDTKVVKRVVGDEYAERVSELPDGRAFVQADWTEADVMEVQFRRKRTFDAGATPGLDDVDRPELKSVSSDLVDELDDISDRKEREQERIAELEKTVQEKEARIQELEDELAQARDVGDAARQMAAALTGDLEIDRSAMEERVMEKDREINRLKSDLADVEAERDELRRRVETFETRLEYETLEEFSGDDGAEGEDQKRDDGARAEEDESATETDETTDAETDDGSMGDPETDTAEADEDDLAERVAELEAALEDREAKIERLEDRLASKEAYVKALERKIAGSDGADEDETDATDDGAEVLVDEGGDHGTEGETAGTSPDRESDDTHPDEGVEILEDGPDSGDDAGDGGTDALGIGAAGEVTERRDVEDDGEDAPDDGAELPDEGAEVIERNDDTDPRPDASASGLVGDLLSEPVTERVLMAYREAECTESETWEVVTALATRGPTTVPELEAHTDADTDAIRSLLLELRRVDLVERIDAETYAFDREAIAEFREDPRRVSGIDDPEFVERLE